MWPRIMIVEDETIVAKDIQNILKGLGYVVVGIVCEGNEAIKKASELAPDLILMDIRLKGDLDGIEAAKRIRETLSIPVPVVYLTAYGDQKTLEKAKLSEPFGYIMKPFVERDLYTTVEIALYRHKIERKLQESELRYKDLYHNAPDGYLTLDYDGTIVEANNTFLALLGFNQEEIMGKYLEDFICSPFKDQFKTSFGQLKKKQPIANLQIDLQRKDKEVVATLINTAAILNEKGQYVQSRWVVRNIQDLKHLREENSLLAERLIKLTRKIPLTDNEKRVFEGLVAFPLYNDIELSKYLKIKRSTVTAIKNRLKRDHFYSSQRIPSFPFLGCELFIVFSAELNPTTHKKDVLIHLLKETAALPEVVYFLGTDKDVLGIFVSKNFTEFKRHMDAIILNYKNYDLLSKINIEFFPFETSLFVKLFSYHAFLMHLFESPTSHQVGNQRFSLARPTKKTLTRKEKNILYALVKYGELNDSEIAEKTNLPRPSISQVRRLLVAEKIIKPVNIPNLLPLKCELLVSTQVRLDPRLEKDTMAHIQDYLNSLPSTCILILGTSSLFMLSAYNDYTDYEREYNGVRSFFNDRHIPITEHHTKIFSIPQTHLQRLQFDSLVSKLLNNDTFL